MTPDNRSVCANDEDLFPIGRGIRAPGILEIPAGGFTRLKGEGCRVVNLPCNKYKARLFWDDELIPGPEFDVVRRVDPAFDLAAYVNDHAPGRRMVFQICDHLILLGLD